MELASAGLATRRPGLLGEVVIELEQQVVQPGVRQKLQGQRVCSLSCRQRAQILIRQWRSSSERGFPLEPHRACSGTWEVTINVRGDSHPSGFQ